MQVFRRKSVDKVKGNDKYKKNPGFVNFLITQTDRNLPEYKHKPLQPKRLHRICFSVKMPRPTRLSDLSSVAGFFVAYGDLSAVALAKVEVEWRRTEGETTTTN
jgi:hypothetical protein